MTEKAVIKSVRYSLGQNYCFLFCLEIVKYDCTNIQRMSEPNLISDYFLSWLTFQQQINNDNDEEIQNHIERIGELPVKDFNKFCHGAKMKSLLTHNFLKWSHIWYHSFWYFFITSIVSAKASKTPKAYLIYWNFLRWKSNRGHSSIFTKHCIINLKDYYTKKSRVWKRNERIEIFRGIMSLLIFLESNAINCYESCERLRVVILNILVIFFYLSLFFNTFFSCELESISIGVSVFYIMNQVIFYISTVSWNEMVYLSLWGKIAGLFDHWRKIAGLFELWGIKILLSGYDSGNFPDFVLEPLWLTYKRSWEFCSRNTHFFPTWKILKVPFSLDRLVHLAMSGRISIWSSEVYLFIYLDKNQVIFIIWFWT